MKKTKQNRFWWLVVFWTGLSWFQGEAAGRFPAFQEGPPVTVQIPTEAEQTEKLRADLQALGQELAVLSTRLNGSGDGQPAMLDRRRLQFSEYAALYREVASQLKQSQEKLAAAYPYLEKLYHQSARDSGYFELHQAYYNCIQLHGSLSETLSKLEQPEKTRNSAATFHTPRLVTHIRARQQPATGADFNLQQVERIVFIGKYDAAELFLVYRAEAVFYLVLTCEQSPKTVAECREMACSAEFSATDVSDNSPNQHLESILKLPLHDLVLPDETRQEMFKMLAVAKSYATPQE